MAIDKHQKDNMVDIKITESATINEIGEIYRCLLESAKDSSVAIHMNLSGINECDISFIQVMIGFKKLLDIKNIFLTLEPLEPTNPFIKCMQICGIHPDYFSHLKEGKYGF